MFHPVSNPTDSLPRDACIERAVPLRKPLSSSMGITASAIPITRSAKRVLSLRSLRRAIDTVPHNSTMPAEPSTTTGAPSAITCVASIAPVTSGMPNSRATIAAREKGPPTSVTAALEMLKSGVQTGVVVWATSTSPGWKRWKSSGPAITRAVPRARPGLPGVPTRICFPLRSCAPRLSTVVPTADDMSFHIRSLPLVGSESGGMKGGGASRLWRSRSRRRCVTRSARSAGGAHTSPRSR